MERPHQLNGAVMSGTADSSYGELSEALQGNAKHEGSISNISDSLRLPEQLIRECSLRSERQLR